MPESFTCHQCHRPQRMGSRRWTKFEPVYSVRPWWGRQGAGLPVSVCVCVSVSTGDCECKCVEIMWYEGVWWLLELNRAGFCWFANKDSGSHLTPRSFSRVYVTLKMRGSFIQLHNDLKANESRSSFTTDLVVVCRQTAILLFVTHTLFAFMSLSTHSNQSVFNDRIKALSWSY